MNLQSILLLDALWNADVQKNKITEICKIAAINEIEYELMGIFNPETIWFSDEAKERKKKLLELRLEIEKIERPSKMNFCMREYKKLIGELQALQMLSMKNLISEIGPTKKNCHIFIRQITDCALEKIREQVKYQLFRLTVLSGEKPEILKEKPSENNSKKWFDYYAVDICNAFEKLSDDVIDGRWKYIIKDFVFGSGKPIPQYISVSTNQDELKKQPGDVVMGRGQDNSIQFCGRGYITNLQIDDMDFLENMDVYTSIADWVDYSEIFDEKENPVSVLSDYFAGKKFLISAECYFTMINQFIIAKKFCSENF